MKKYIQPILEAIGYYKLKSEWRRHQYISRLQKENVVRKAEAMAWIEAIDHRLLPNVKNTDNITVSLTSHGRRLSDFAPVAIHSIFLQSMLPNRIVLNINQENWNEDNLPESIKKLQVAGLEVNFCEDVGPHTKLLPTIQKYPDDVIITIDDDICYDKGLIADLVSDYRKKNEPCVICKSALVVSFENGQIKPYSQWPRATKRTSQDVLLSPYGYCGVLYAPHIFSDEVFNKLVYQEHCKYADDIWFTIIEMIEQIPVYLSSVPRHDVMDVDYYNEFVAQESDALHFSNDEGGRNDVQLRALVEYYNLNKIVNKR